MTRLVSAAVALVTLAAVSRQGEPTIAIQAERVMTMTAQGTIGPAVVVVRGGRIQAVGAAKTTPVPAGATTLTARVVTPGLIDARTTLGLAGLIRADDEQDERTEPNQAHLRAVDGFNLQEPMLRHALEAGVTVVQTGPGEANAIGGLAGIFKTFATSTAAATVRFPSALVIALTEVAKNTYGEKGKYPSTRMATVGLVRQALIDAEDYGKRLVGPKPPDRDVKHEAVLLALKRDIPVLVSVSRVDELATALRVADEFKLRVVLVGATDAHLIVDRLRVAQVPVLVGPPGDRIFDEAVRDQRLALPATLKAQQVPFAIVSGDDEEAPRVVLLQAVARATAFGLDPETALAAVTINAARILGVEARLGSIEPGKDADLVLFDGEPFSARARVTAVLVNGEIAYRRSS